MFNRAKLIPILLSLALLFGVMTPAVMAAEVNFQYDFLESEFSLRGEQAPLLVEIPFANKKWKGLSEKAWGLSGFNIGLKGPKMTPFYLKMQFNWLRSTDTDKFNFYNPEVGFGGVYDLWGYTSFGAEVSFANPTAKNIGNADPRLELFFKYKFDQLLGFDTNTEP